MCVSCASVSKVRFTVHKFRDFQHCGINVTPHIFVSPKRRGPSINLHPFSILQPLIQVNTSKRKKPPSFQDNNFHIRGFSHLCILVRTFETHTRNHKSFDRSVNPQLPKRLYQERSHFHILLCSPPFFFLNTCLLLNSEKTNETLVTLTELRMCEDFCTVNQFF